MVLDRDCEQCWLWYTIYGCQTWCSLQHFAS